MNNSQDVAPLREQDVKAMGLALGGVCTTQHRPGMKAHRHVELAQATEPEGDAIYVTHSCPTCGHVHLPPETTA